MNNILFSIIIPAYNATEFIGECVKSILDQTYDNYEIIIIDDGSTDNTLKKCKQLFENNDKIRIFHQENKGVGLARVAGTNKAQGEYLIFCDSDDMLHPETLESISKVIEDTDADVITFKMSSDFKKTKRGESGKFYNKKAIEKYIFPYLLEDKNGKYFKPSVCGAAYRRRLYIENQVKNCRIEIGEDLACMKSIIFNANSLYEMNDVFYFYRRNILSATMSHKVFLWNGPELIGKHIESKININSFDMKEQLNRVITHQLFLVVKSQFNRKERYIDIRRDIISNLKNEYYKQAINNCKYSYRNIKGNLALWALRHRIIILIYFFNKCGNIYKKLVLLKAF